MKIIEQDILTITRGSIFQQVNCQGVMGSGLAKSIRDKWPTVFTEYERYCKGRENDFQLLGAHQFVNVELGLFICNVFGQLHYGKDGKRYTDYGAILTAFRDVIKEHGDMVYYFPYNFGCDRGGGDWAIVSKMINYYFPKAIICKLPG